MNKVLRQSVMLAALVVVAGLTAGVRTSAAQTLAPEARLCDPTFADCRADILTFINQEQVEIDMGFWMMTDARYANALVAAWQRGVKIRLLMDPRCSIEHPACSTQNDTLASAGIPMRNRNTSGILHWKMAIFAGQGQVEFSGANYAPFEMTPETPWVNFTDEIVFFTNDPSIVQSMMTRFDDLWTSTTEFVDYANVTAPLTRSYPVSAIDPELNFPPDDSYRTRSINAYNAETQKIDVFMFRITDERQSDAIIAAINRGIPVRLITDTGEYRNTARLWDAYNVDKMYHAGVQVRLDAHQGIDHAKGVLLYGQGLSIFGSSNWTSPSSDTQREHNYFTTKAWIFTWLQNLFDRKWNNSSGNTETGPFTPLPPDVPVYNAPANGATGIDSTTAVTLTWNGGLWAHLYDIYFGTSPNPPLLASNQKLGPSQYSTDYRKYTLPFTLQPGTTYYWKIVSKTMAYVTAAGPVWSFTTAGTNQPPAVTLTSPANGATFNAGANITLSASASDSDGSVMKVDFYQGSTLIGSDSSSPYTATWTNVPAGNYSLTAVATDNALATTTSTPVSITVGASSSGLPTGWASQDVGATGAAGSSSYSGGTYSVTGAGADIWGTADAFQYAYRTLTGDGSIVARVATVASTASWFKAGVMIRNNLTAASAQGMMLVSYSKGTAFQRRTADGNTSLSTAGSTSTAPRWVKLTRSGNTVTAYESANGTSWTQVGSDTIALGSTAYIGLAVSSHVNGVLGTATFDNVTVSATTNAPPSVVVTSPADGSTYTAPATIAVSASASDTDGTIARVDFYAGTTLLGSDTASPYSLTWSNVPAGTYSLTAVATDNQGATTTAPAVGVNVTTGSQSPLPPGWADGDIGSVPIAGSATFSNNVFSVTGSGADIWGTADAFHYAYTQMTGDGTIVARVASVQNVASWVKAGVMIRETLSPSSTHAFMLVSAAKGVAFQRRTVTGGTSTNTAGSLSTAPRWVRLVRSGNTFSAYESADGATWTLVGTDTIPMASTVYVGLAVTSHSTSASATCTLDGVTIQ